MSSTKLITILGLIGFGQAAADFTTLLDKHVEGPQYQFAMMKHMPENRKFFAYGNCTNSVPPKSIQVTECNIFRESLTGQADESSCRVPLNGVILDFDRSMILHDFDDDKVIVYYYTEEDTLPNYYIRFMIVQFSNCSTAEAKIRYDHPVFRNHNFGKSLGTILPKGEKFTVAIDKSGLFGNKVDEQTFDARGNTVGNIVSWFLPLSKESIMIMDNYNNNNALLEFDVQSRQFRFSLINENALKVLNLSTFVDYSLYDVSALHDTLRLCHFIRSSSKVDCNTFTANGEFISKNSLELNHNATKVTVHNLLDGNFFLITTTKSSDTSEKLLYINKFTADGKHIITMELPGYKCNGKKVDTIPYENEKDQHCVMRICTNPNDFGVLIKCFNNEDIK